MKLNYSLNIHILQLRIWFKEENKICMYCICTTWIISVIVKLIRHKVLVQRDSIPLQKPVAAEGPTFWRSTIFNSDIRLTSPVTALFSILAKIGGESGWVGGGRARAFNAPQFRRSWNLKTNPPKTDQSHTHKR